MIRPHINSYTEYCYWNAVYKNSFGRLLVINAELEQILSRPFLKRILSFRRVYRLKHKQVRLQAYHANLLLALSDYVISLNTAV